MLPTASILIIVTLCGCLGGFLNAFLNHPENRPANAFPADHKTFLKEIHAWKTSLLYKRSPCDTLFPGIPGSIVFGGLAALVAWCVYSPAARATLIGTAPPQLNPYLTYQELPAYFAVGLGGLSWIMNLSKRLCAEKQ